MGDKITFVWILFALAGCATPSPAIRRIDTRTESMGVLLFPEAAQPPTTSYRVFWSWTDDDGSTNLPSPDAEFDLEHKLTLDPSEQWSLYCRTNQPPVVISNTNNQEFFRIGVHYVTSTNPSTN